MYGLASGSYYVSASYSPGQYRADVAPDTGYPPVYYPGASDPGAALALDVHAGDELPGIDFSLVRVRTFKVSGKVYDGVNGRPGAHTMIFLVARSSEVRTWLNASQISVQDPQGAFELFNVRPGSYYLMALTFDGNQRYTARENLDVSTSDVEGVNLVVGPGVDLRGRFRIEGNSTLDINALNGWLQPRDELANYGGGSLSIKPDGTFVASNVQDSDYQLQLWGLPDDFYLKSLRAGSDDVLVSSLSVSRKRPPGALEVVLSPNGGRIDGQVLNGGKATSGATVVLVPNADHRKEERLYRSTSTDQEGQFSIRGIVPGDYKLFAWETVEEGASQDPEFLRPYDERGKAVHVDEGTRLNSQLELISTNEPSAQ